MSTRYDFSGRAAVVTGGAQGIGRAIVERLLSGGAAVAIWDRQKEAADATADQLKTQGKVVALALDVSDENAVAAARDATIKALGKIDILVNNAGINGINAKVVDYPVDQWTTSCASTCAARSSAAAPSCRA